MLFEPSEVHWYGSFGFSGPSLGAGHGLPPDDTSAAFGFFGNTQFSGGHFGGMTPHSSTPAPTLVGPAGGLQIDLVWDPSVAHAPKGFEKAVVTAALAYTKLFSDDIVIKIRVGYGEVNGQRLDSGALGESESNYKLVSYTTVAGALAGDNYPLTLAGNEPMTAQIYVTNAEAKALGLMSGTATGVDGWIGLGNSSSITYSLGGPAGGSGKYDAVAIAEHEIGEVMGRIGMEGEMVKGHPTYTVLDLFNFSSPGVLELSANGGYFSIDNGVTSLGNFNNAAANGGDIADWSSNSKPSTHNYDAYDAFTYPGYHGVITARDVIETAALGYDLTPTGVASV
jgi:hypothetical protein